GTITKVNVTLTNFAHAFPDDVDILLVGPAGQQATILSDVGGSVAVSGLTLTLNDAAAASLPDSTGLSSGTFKPRNVQAGGALDSFPSPAPSPTGASVLSAFNNTNPNGVWSLYIVDDSSGNAGSL